MTNPIRFVVVSTVAIGAAWLLPAQALSLVDPDRSVRPVPPGLALAVRTAVAMFLVASWAAVAWLLSGGTSARLRKAFADWWRQPGSPASLLVLAGLMALGLWLRWEAYRLPMSYDESTSVVWFSSRSWLDVVSDHTIPNNHIFYNLITHLLTTVAGIAPWAVRLPALVAGVLCVPAMYWLTMRLWSREAALLGAALVAAAPMMLEYSGQGRGYTLHWLFFLVAFALATHLRDNDDLRTWVVFGLATVLGIWTIPTMLYGIITIGLWLLITAAPARRRTLALHGVVAGAAVFTMAGLLYLPAIVRTGLHQSPGLASLRPYLRIPAQWVAGLPWPFVVLLCAGVAAALAYRESRRASLAILVAGAAAHVILSFVVNVPPARVVFYQFFVIAGIGCHGVDLLTRSWRSVPRTRLLPIGVAVAFAVAWGWSWRSYSRSSIDAAGLTWLRGKEPGSDDLRCCADGYFSDAEPIVAAVMPQLGHIDAIVTENLTGTVETMRFHLIAHGRSPVLVHPYRRKHGLLDQLAPYENLFVVVRGEDHRPPEADFQSTVLPMLGVDEATLAQIYRRPELVARFRISAVYLVRRLRPRRPEDVPRKVPFNMLWYW